MKQGLQIFLFLTLVCAQPAPLWHVGYDPSTSSQVDDLALNAPSQRVFVEMLVKDTFGYDMATGDNTWGSRSFSGAFGITRVARMGHLLVTLSESETSPPSVAVSAFSASGGTQAPPLWSLSIPSSGSQNLQVSEDGSVVALGVTTIVKANNSFSSYVLLLNGETGKVVNKFSCNGSDTNNLLALDSTGKMLAFDCLPQGGQTTTIFVRPALGSNKTSAFLATQATASAGTGFALARGGAFFAHGAVQTHVFKLVGSTYQLLFVRDPVPASIPRLLEAMAFQNEDSKEGPLLATGYFQINTANQQQQSFVEVFDMQSPTVSQPIWRYFLANSTLQLEDSIAQLRFCGGARVLAMASWGLGPGVTPTVHVLNGRSGALLLNYTTPGSMMSIDCLIGGPTHANVWTTAGGKREHANIMGSGGDVYMWKFSLKG